MSFELMARDTIAFMETVVGGPAHLVGCSDGATVALVTALLRPDLARRLVLVAGAFHYDGWAPGVLEPDDDEVTLEHAAAMYRRIPGAELAVVPGTSHGLMVEKPAVVNQLMVDFLTTDPIPTIAPIRRAAASQGQYQP
jgi:pimeloyl-ACP methyl ester carboxylesterase